MSGLSPKHLSHVTAAQVTRKSVAFRVQNNSKVCEISIDFKHFQFEFNIEKSNKRLWNINTL